MILQNLDVSIKCSISTQIIVLIIFKKFYGNAKNNFHCYINYFECQILVLIEIDPLNLEC